MVPCSSISTVAGNAPDAAYISRSLPSSSASMGTLVPVRRRRRTVSADSGSTTSVCTWWRPNSGNDCSNGVDEIRGRLRRHRAGERQRHRDLSEEVVERQVPAGRRRCRERWCGLARKRVATAGWPNISDGLARSRVAWRGRFATGVPELGQHERLGRGSVGPVGQHQRAAGLAARTGHRGDGGHVGRVRGPLEPTDRVLGDLRCTGLLVAREAAQRRASTRHHEVADEPGVCELPEDLGQRGVVGGRHRQFVGGRGSCGRGPASVRVAGFHAASVPGSAPAYPGTSSHDGCELMGVTEPGRLRTPTRDRSGRRRRS